MNKVERINFAVTGAEKRALNLLVARQFRSGAEILRTLLRREAAAEGLWPPSVQQSADTNQEAENV